VVPPWPQRDAVAMELSPLPPPRLLHASRIDSGGRSEALRHLDHIGFNDLRTYFYMPFNRAATTMKVRLTVLKQCSHELGILWWPYQKLKSLNHMTAQLGVMINSMLFFPLWMQSWLRISPACNHGCERLRACRRWRTTRGSRMINWCWSTRSMS
jgi:hypothetical protein